jgi:hypothetical protein
VTTAALVNELVEAEHERELSNVVGRFGRLDLLCLEELAPRSAGCRAALPGLDRAGRVGSDPRLAGAVVDRLTLRAHILETGASSYRLRTSQARPKEGPPAVLISDPIEGQPIGRGWGPGVITVGPNGLSLPP